MKNENDLLEALVRHCFEGSGAPEHRVDLLMHEFRTKMKSRMKANPKTLSDEEFASQLEKMKQEAPAHLHFLMTNQFPDLPGDLRGENN